MPQPRRYLIITLAATYPDGSVGYVTGMHLRRPPFEWALGDLASRSRAPEGLLDAIDGMLALYRAEIGPAYAMEDFTFTIFEADDRVDLFFLMGRAFLERDGVPGTQRPRVGGVAGLVR